MSTEPDPITCTRRDWNQFWADTFQAYERNVYLDAGGPSDDDWDTDDPDHVMSFMDGDLAWQSTDHVTWASLPKPVARRLDTMMERGLRALFLHWRQQNTGDRVTVTVSIPASAMAALDTWLAANDGTRP